MKRKIISAVLPFFLATASFTGCTKDDGDDDTTVKEDEEDEEDEEEDDATMAAFTIQLNSSVTSLLGIATSLTAKLGGVDLIADCAGDAPPGDCLDLGRSPDPDIWVNEGCNDDIAQCTTANTEFFELIDPSAANTVLNSQGRSIEAGTFTKVRIYFLNNDDGTAIECDGAASAVRPGIPITVTLPEAIVVEAGDTVTVTLNYDPSAVDCADDTTISSAISAMTATVTIQ